MRPEQVERERHFHEYRQARRQRMREIAEGMQELQNRKNYDKGSIP